MKTSESIKAILPAMLKVQDEMKSLTKDRDNPFANSKYVTLDNILDNLKPILTQNDLILIQNPLAITDEKGSSRIGVETRVYHKDGEYFDFGEFLLGFEKGSKMNMAQSAGSITSYAKRYALTAIFSIDTNEDTDGVHGMNQQQNYQQQGNQQQYQQQQNYQQPNQQQDNQQHNQPQKPTRSMQQTIQDGLNKLRSMETGWSEEDVIALINDKYKINFKEISEKEQLGYVSQFYRFIGMSNQAKQQQPQPQTQQPRTDWRRVNNA